MITFEQFTERVYKGLKADLTKGKPHWDDLSEKEREKLFIISNNPTILSRSDMRITPKDESISEIPCIFPKNMDRYELYFRDCSKLVSLDGLPEDECGALDLQGCISLTSLKGSPKKVTFLNCYGCDSLKSLENGTKEVELIDVRFCGRSFSISYIDKHIKVTKRIYESSFTERVYKGLKADLTKETDVVTYINDYLKTKFIGAGVQTFNTMFRNNTSKTKKEFTEHIRNLLNHSEYTPRVAALYEYILQHIDIVYEELKNINLNEAKILSVYHGDNFGLKEINKNYKLMFQKNGNSQEGPGIYFAEDKSVAEGYGEHVVKIKIDISKLLPSRVSLIKVVTINSIINLLKELAKKDEEFFYYFTDYGIEVNSNQEIKNIHYSKVASILGSEQVRNVMIELTEKVGIELFTEAWLSKIKKHGTYNKELGFYALLYSNEQIEVCDKEK